MHTILGINGAVGPDLAAALRQRNIPLRGLSRRLFPGDWEHRQADVTQPGGSARCSLGTDERADSQVWHVPTSPERWTGEDWVKAAAAAFGIKPKFRTIPTFALRLMGLGSRLFREMVEMNYQYTHDYIFSSEKFERTFGLKPTPNQQGVAETAAYYKNYKK